MGVYKGTAEGTAFMSQVDRVNMEDIIQKKVSLVIPLAAALCPGWVVLSIHQGDIRT
jgi:hypothetical protein